jgi:hypothetical protein
MPRHTPPSPQARPLRALTATQLDQHFDVALAAGDALGAAHAVHESWMRGGFAATIESRLERLWSRCAATVPEWLPMQYVDWLPLAYEVASRFRPAARGRHHVYLVLLDFADRRGDPHGVYVGMSGYPPGQRFDQHKAGIRASGSVLKRGLEVLYGPALHLQRISRAEALRIEADLARALADAGLAVEGGH